MSDENFTKPGSQKSLLAQVKEDAAKAKRESVKAQLKTLYNDYNASVEVTKGIEQKIVTLLQTVGETEGAIKELLID